MAGLVAFAGSIGLDLRAALGELRQRVESNQLSTDVREYPVLCRHHRDWRADFVHAGGLWLCALSLSWKGSPVPHPHCDYFSAGDRDDHSHVYLLFKDWLGW